MGFILALTLGSPAAQADFTIGQNFTGSTLFDSGFIPPDTMGAVGQNYIVELINGRYSVYRKSDGVRVQTSSLNGFWTNAGVNYSGSYAFDPRVVYDPFSQRWFAASADNPKGANNFLIGVSNSSNPTSGWTGFAIDSDAGDSHWADFPTMGFDNNGVYLAANMFSLSGGGVNTTIVAIPKADLVGGGTPTVANAKKWENRSGLGFSLQPIVDMDNTGTPARLLSAYDTGTGSFKRSSITWPVISPVLDTSGGFISVAACTPPPDADQPGPKQNIETNDTRLGSNVILRDGSIWGVQAVENGGNSALRWFEIDEATNSLLQEGLISDNELDFYFGSIAVNEFGEVVIGFSGSSGSQYISSYAVLGQTVGGVTSFGEPLLLKAGVDDYERLDKSDRNRWGDYSATVLDPNEAHTFWTFQEWVSADNVWSTQITELQVQPIPEPATLLLLGLGSLALLRKQKRRAKGIVTQIF